MSHAETPYEGECGGSPAKFVPRRICDEDSTQHRGGAFSFNSFTAIRATFVILHCNNSRYSAGQPTQYIANRQYRNSGIFLMVFRCALAETQSPSRRSPFSKTIKPSHSNARIRGLIPSSTLQRFPRGSEHAKLAEIGWRVKMRRSQG